MAANFEREQIIRVDCPVCRQNGYVVKNGQQEVCGRCGGVGMVEGKVPYRPEGYSVEEAGEMLGVPNPKIARDRHDSAFDVRPPTRDE